MWGAPPPEDGASRHRCSGGPAVLGGSRCWAAGGGAVCKRVRSGAFIYLHKYETVVHKGRTALAHNNFNPKFIENNNVRLCALTISVISSFSRFHTRKLQLCSTLAIKMNSQGACKLLLKHGFKPLLGRDLKIKLVITECLRGRVTSFILGVRGSMASVPNCVQRKAEPAQAPHPHVSPPRPASHHLRAEGTWIHADYLRSRMASSDIATVLLFPFRRSRPRFYNCYFFHSISYQPRTSAGILRDLSFSVCEHSC